ncbi:MAG: rRNA pseudouridine synthase [Deltaproteobacteria bacterium]|nr:rRNA pseudouridine synthase [Deltaproteobacteria bacterium]
MNNTFKQRIQKVLSESGLYSRRAVEQMIDDRKIKVNGIVVTAKGIKVDPLQDRIQVCGRAFKYTPQEETIAILFNKPRRVVVTRHDPEDRKTVYDFLPEKFKTLKPVGRLDYNTQGALILTNDGDLILKLTHPRYHLSKVYEVKLSSHPEERLLERLRRGVIIDGQRTLPAEINVISKHRTSTLLEFVLHEGKNRQIRRMCELVGLTVKELRRVAIGPVRIKSLHSGKFRILDPAEIAKLKNLTSEAR